MNSSCPSPSPRALHCPPAGTALFRRIQAPLHLRLLYVFITILSALHISATAARGQNEGINADSEYITTHWYAENGLPHNIINDVIRDSQGFLWVATEGGIARFDGRYFTKYPIPEEYTRNRPPIRALAVEDNRTLVMITGDGRILRLRDGNLEPHPIDALRLNKATQTPLDIAIDDTGALWLGMTESVIRWENGKMQEFAAESGIGTRRDGYCFASDANNRNWVSGYNYLGWYDAEGLHRYSLPGEHAIRITKSRTGGLWIVSQKSLSKLENGKRRIVLDDDEWPVAKYGIQHLYEAQDGVLWIATRRDGVFQLVDGKLKNISLQRSESITEDIDGNIWIGSNGSGLARLKPKHYTLLNKASGMPMDVSSSVTQDETGAIWFANQSGGVVCMKDGNIIKLHVSNGENIFATNICADLRGRVWVGTFDGIYFTETAAPGEKMILRKSTNNEIKNVHMVYCAKNGDVWVAWSNRGDQFCGRVRDGQLKIFTAENGQGLNRPTGILEYQHGNGQEIWVVNNRGQFYKLPDNSDHFVEQTMPPVALPSQINALHADAAGRIWFGTTKGLLLWDAEKPRLFTSADGLPDDVLYQIVTDDHGRLWASCRRSIFVVQIDQLLAVKAGTKKQITPTLFGRDDDLEGLAGMTGGPSMAWKTREGRIWFATYRGMLGFDAPAPANPNHTLPVYIESITINENPAITAITPENDKPVKVYRGAKQIEFTFAALNFSTPERTRVRRKLEGFDVGWIDASGERSAVYSRVPPGVYTFRVEVDDFGGNTQSASASLAIEVMAEWWQTVWFRVCTILAVVIFVAIAARFASNRILKQRLRRLEYEEALTKERTRIARDLHDELGSKLSQIGFIVGRAHQQVDQPRPKEMLGRLILQTRSLVEDLHRIIWTVNPQNDSWQRLAEYISRYTQRLLHDTAIVCMIDGVSGIPDQPITPEIRNHLISITKEALNNMLKHSKADHLSITMAANNGIFHLNINDNGCGFDTSAQQSSDQFGVTNMRERMLDVGGHIEIESYPQRGTQIKVTVPLAIPTIR